MKVGVLALQGAFREHQQALEACGADTCQIRLPEHLNQIDALVIPGGESTTMGKLLIEYQLLEPIKEMGQKGLPIFGTCAGMIVLANNIVGSNQLSLGLMDISVERNAFGRQVDSFEGKFLIPALGEPDFNAVFIRAPYIDSVGPDVKVMAEYQGKIVMAEEKNFLAAAFHPELTDDLRLHKYFINKI